MVNVLLVNTHAKLAKQNNQIFALPAKLLFHIKPILMETVTDALRTFVFNAMLRILRDVMNVLQGLSLSTTNALSAR